MAEPAEVVGLADGTWWFTDPCTGEERGPFWSEAHAVHGWHGSISWAKQPAWYKEGYDGPGEKAFCDRMGRLFGSVLGWAHRVAV